MSVSVNIQVKGLSETLSKLDGYSKEVSKEVSNIIQKGGLDIERDAAKKAPVDTGFLSSRIHYSPIDKFSCEIEDRTSYGIFQEFGTSKMRAQPFLLPAVNENLPKIEARVVAATQDSAKQ